MTRKILSGEFRRIMRSRFGSCFLWPGAGSGWSGADAPGAEEAVEISTVDLSIMVDVAGAGGRAVVARSAFGPAAAEFGAVGFRVDPAST